MFSLFGNGLGSWDAGWDSIWPTIGGSDFTSTGSGAPSTGWDWGTGLDTGLDLLSIFSGLGGFGSTANPSTTPSTTTGTTGSNSTGNTSSGDKPKDMDQSIWDKMPSWAKYLLKLGVPIASLVSVLGATGVLGGNNSILPTSAQALWPEGQASYGNWLFGNVGKGSTPYTGQLTPDVSKTMLPNVYSSWQQTNPATSYLTQLLNQGVASAGQSNPMLKQIMQWGGTGGVGNNFMSLLAQYGAPSQAGQYVSNMAQFGVASPGSGQYLANMAQGKTPAGADYLMPFLSGAASRKG